MKVVPTENIAAAGSLSFVVAVVDVTVINEVASGCCWSVERGLAAIATHRAVKEQGTRGGAEAIDTDAATARPDGDGTKASAPVSNSSSSSSDCTATSAFFLEPLPLRLLMVSSFKDMYWIFGSLESKDMDKVLFWIFKIHIFLV
jgi:hypothetical protein